MNITAIIQARTGATRLPGKVLIDLCGRTVLSHVIARAKACPRVNGVIVATTKLPADDAVAAEATKNGCVVHRGSSDDVLSRYYEAARDNASNIIIRITSDCPLLDPDVVSAMISRFLELSTSTTHPAHYLSNTVDRTYPRGLDAEVFSFAALERAHEAASKPYEREHVTPFIYQHPELFRIEQFRGDKNLSSLRWTLDTPDDLNLIRAIYEALYRPEAPLFKTAQVLELLRRRPELSRLNAHIKQKELGQ